MISVIRLRKCFSKCEQTLPFLFAEVNRSKLKMREGEHKLQDINSECKNR